jgi:thiol-disulfide isomerase/thioredoxin
MIKFVSFLFIALLSISSHAMQHGSSAAGKGKNETTCTIASLKCAKAPSASFGPDGKLWLAWVFGGHVYVQHSVDNGASFSQPLSVNRAPEKITARAENRAKIQLDNAGNIYISWTQPLNKPYTGNIRFSRSVDGGKTFSKPITVNDDHQEISHRFDSMVVSDDGKVFISWLDKRDQQAAKDKQQEYIGGALYYSYSDDQGQTFSKNMNLSDNSCVCCRIAMALDNNNLPVIAWRDIYGNDIHNQIRDHSLLTFRSALKPNKKIRLSHEQWNIDGCPHHGPALDVDSNNVIHSTWFNDVSNEEQGSDYVLFYGNSISGFNISDYKPMGFGQVDKQSAHPYVLTSNQRATKDQMVFLVWKEFDGKKTDILLKTSKNSGTSWSDRRVISTTAGASDHPLLVKNSNSVYLSWHTQNEGYRFIELSSIAELVEVNLKTLDMGRFEKIVADKNKQDHLVVLWSFDCPPCITELKKISELHRQYPEYQLTLINTDSMDEQTRVKKMLADYNLRGLDNWGFSDIDAEKLRYDIDSRWFGDLPRSYFFPVNGKVKRLRGALTSAELRALFQPS